jgi:hypothetical protein
MESFSDYEEWTAVYDKYEDEQSETPSSVLHLQEVTLGLADRLILIVLDMSVRVVQELEHEATTTSTLKSVWNAIKALILTFRFGTSHRHPQHRKLVYLRRVASERLINLLDREVERGSLQDLQERIRRDLKSAAPQAQDAWNRWFMETNFQNAYWNKNVHNSTNGGSLVALEVAGVSPPPTIPARRRPTLGRQLWDLAETMFVESSQDLNLYISAAMDQLLVDFCSSKFLPNRFSFSTQKMTSHRPMTDEMMDLCEKQYKSLQESVCHEVSSLTDGVIGAMLSQRV